MTGPVDRNDESGSMPTASAAGHVALRDAPPGPFRALDVRPGTVIAGRYKLLQQIGQGGFGVVFLAEQEQPVRRKVAVKLIKLGMDTEQVIARFESERQALALLSHPNVAAVYDAGATESGRPYFVMECVPGEPITTFCDRHNYTTRQRLELFIQACDAIQHAHQKAIIHRDVKPSNLLVMLKDDKPLLKVIDFGVAKATAQRLTERTLFTEHGQLIGTPEYMSPEQAEMNALDVDTRTDIYSLGVVLYELLTGAVPFDAKTLRNAAFAQIQRIIREQDPPRPSTRLSSLGESAVNVAKHRQTPLASLQRELRGDVEWIPLRALRKDPGARYRTAAEFAEDVQNYLHDRPLNAGPESARYRFRKYVRRNSRTIAFGAVLAATLVLATAFSSWQAVRATRAEARAKERATEAESANETTKAVNEFMAQMLSGDLVKRVPGDRVTVAQVTKAATEKLDAGALRDRPITEAAVRSTIGGTQSALSLFNDAEVNLSKSLELRRAHLPPDHLDIAGSLGGLGELQRKQRRYDLAASLFRDALDVRRRSLPAEERHYSFNLTALALVLREQVQTRPDRAVTNLAEAEQLARKALAIRRRLNPDNYDTMHAMQCLAQTLTAQGRYAEAERILRDCMQLVRTAKPESGLRYDRGPWEDMGRLLRAQKRLAEARQLQLDLQRQFPEAQLGRDPSQSDRLIELASVYRDEGKFDKAEPLFRQALEVRYSSLPTGHPAVASSLSILSNCLVSMGGKQKELNELCDTIGAGYRRDLGQHREQYGDSATTAQSFYYLGNLFARAGRTKEAEEDYRNALSIRIDVFGPNHTLVRFAQYRLTELFIGQKRFADAEPILLSVHETLVEHNERNKTADVIGRLINLYADWGKEAEVTRWRAKLSELRTPSTATRPSSRPTTNPKGSLPVGPRGTPLLDPRFIEADELAAASRLREAVKLLLDIRSAAVPAAVSEDKAAARDRLILLYKRLNELDKALELMSSKVKNASKGYQRGTQNFWRVAQYQAEYAEVLIADGQFEQAEAVLRDANENCQAFQLGMVFGQFVNLYEKWGKPEEAGRWREQLAAATTRPTTQPGE